MYVAVVCIYYAILTYLRYGAGDDPFGVISKNLSARSPSAMMNTHRLAFDGRREACGVVPFTRVVVK